MMLDDFAKRGSIGVDLDGSYGVAYVQIHPDYLLDLIRCPVQGAMTSGGVVFPEGDRIPDDAHEVRAWIGKHGTVCLTFRSKEFSPQPEGSAIRQLDVGYRIAHPTEFEKRKG